MVAAGESPPRRLGAESPRSGANAWIDVEDQCHSWPSWHTSSKGHAILTNFYQAFAPTSFTLLGLWLIVVQTRHAEWRGVPALRIRAYAVTLNFALPGLMSLLSLVDPKSSTEWRVSFAVVSIGGALALLVLARRGRIRTEGNLLAAGALVVAVLSYALVAIVAIVPSLVSDNLSLTPLRSEAILLSVLIFLGVNVAWLLMFDEAGS